MATCKVGTLLTRPRTLGRTDRAVLAGWCETGTVEDQPVPATIMAKALTREGHEVSATTLKDHRRGDCACAREDA